MSLYFVKFIVQLYRICPEAFWDVLHLELGIIPFFYGNGIEKCLPETAEGFFIGRVGFCQFYIKGGGICY